MKKGMQEASITIHFTVLGAFAKFRKATVSFVMSVRLSVRVEQLGSPGQVFLKFNTFEDFTKIYEESPSFIKIWQD
jgi:hypothetical protein